MSFANILDQIVTSGQTRQNILTDGQFTCTYGEVPALLEQIAQFAPIRPALRHRCK